MHASHAAIALIEEFEQLSLAPYQDVAGHWTVGWGHRFLPWERIAPVTRETADTLLREDVAKIDARLATWLLGVPLSQPAWDAVVSLTYNIGLHALNTSTLLRCLRAGDLAGAALQFPLWNKGHNKAKEMVVLDALVKRRKAEQSLFMSVA